MANKNAPAKKAAPAKKVAVKKSASPADKKDSNVKVSAEVKITNVRDLSHQWLGNLRDTVSSELEKGNKVSIVITSK